MFLTANNIVKRYARHLALDNVSIQVPEGKVFGLLGPNGAGKTTLIRILNRITMPDEGSVTFNGHPLCEADIKQIGYLPEERGLYKKMKVGEQAVYLARLKCMSERDAKALLQLWFEKFEIMPWWVKKLEELSKGMQQKVQFVITVLHRPQLLIFDEPFSGFDPVNAELLKREILELKEQGHTIIFSSHNMHSVEDICDNIALINHSQVVLSGNIRDIKQQFRTGLFEATLADGQLQAEPGAFEIDSADLRNGQPHYVLRNTGMLTNSQLAIQLAQQAELQGFAETLPTMNDIFLQVVGETNPELKKTEL